MRIGLVSRVGMYPLENWEEEFKVAASLEAKHIELIVNYPYFGPSSYTPAEMFKIKDLSYRYNLELIFHLLPRYEHAPENVRDQFISCYGRKKFAGDEKILQNRFFDIASLDEGVRKFSVQELKRTYDLATLADAKLITIHGGYFESFRTYNDHVEQARETLENLNGMFKQVKLCIENLPIMGHRGQIPYELPLEAVDVLALIKNLDMGICFDIGHANTVGDPFDFYHGLKQTGKIMNVHLHDNNKKADDHLPLNKGDIDFTNFFQLLKQDKYDGYVSIELDTWCRPPEKMSKKERIEGMKYIKKILTELH